MKLTLPDTQLRNPELILFEDDPKYSRSIRLTLSNGDDFFLLERRPGQLEVHLSGNNAGTILALLVRPISTNVVTVGSEAL